MGRQRGIQYRPGSFYRVDDRSGFTRRAESTKQEWNSLIVGKDLWEIRQPQDFVRGVPDDQTVPNPRLDGTPVFYGPFYFTLTAAVGPGVMVPLTTEDGAPITTEDGQYILVDADPTILYLNTLAGITIGDKGAVMMDNGVLFGFTIVGFIGSTGIQISARVPYPASAGNDVIDYRSQETGVAP